MVAPSDPDAQPRRDGWLERPGTWGEVTVGSVLGGPRRTAAWEVIAEAHGAQTIDNYTLWFKIRDLSTGTEHPIEPKPKDRRVIFLMRDDDATPPPRALTDDAEAVALLVEHLGAREIATRDETTGEVWCPDYASGESTTPGSNYYGIEELEHLRICHGLDTTGLEAMAPDVALVERAKIHGRLHSPRGQHEPHGGFPHRHNETWRS